MPSAPPCQAAWHCVPEPVHAATAALASTSGLGAWKTFDIHLAQLALNILVLGWYLLISIDDRDTMIRRTPARHKRPGPTWKLVPDVAISTHQNRSSDKVFSNMDTPFCFLSPASENQRKDGSAI
ncbi:hypothetical protein [Piscinibacter terrae]|uniref:hypothetical protein n=1 Tax=Piscinibacter terrae TaxID=2496871 RepID=UPI0013871A1B|nr:hypothetical protein [Albitalea terrae]